MGVGTEKAEYMLHPACSPGILLKLTRHVSSDVI